MKSTRTPLVAAVLAAAVVGFGAASAPAVAQQKFVTIGTGGVTGVYYAAGGAICRLVNKDRAKHGIRCSVESTGASVFNTNTIRAGELDLGFSQSDVQYNALKGNAPFKEAGAVGRSARRVLAAPRTDHRRRAQGSRTSSRLPISRASASTSAIPARAPAPSMEELLAAMGWKLSDFSLASELKADEHGPALCDGKIDGFAYGVGHPSANIQDPTTSCGAKLVSLTGPVDRQADRHRSRSTARRRSPAACTRTTRTPRRPSACLATVISSSKMPAESVYQVVKAVFDNFEEFKKLHPALANLKPENMIKDGPVGAAARRRRALLQVEGLDQVIPARVAVGRSSRCNPGRRRLRPFSLCGQTRLSGPAVACPATKPKVASDPARDSMATDIEKAPEALQELVAKADTGARKPAARSARSSSGSRWPGRCSSAGTPRRCRSRSTSASSTTPRRGRYTSHSRCSSPSPRGRRSSRSPRDRVPWQDWILAFAGAFAAAYIIDLLPRARDAPGQPDGAGHRGRGDGAPAAARGDAPRRRLADGRARRAVHRLQHGRAVAARGALAQGRVAQPADVAHVAHHRGRVRHRARRLHRHHLRVRAVRHAARPCRRRQLHDAGFLRGARPHARRPGQGGRGLVGAERPHLRARRCRTSSPAASSPSR